MRAVVAFAIAVRRVSLRDPARPADLHLRRISGAQGRRRCHDITDQATAHGVLQAALHGSERARAEPFGILRNRNRYAAR